MVIAAVGEKDLVHLEQAASGLCGAPRESPRQGRCFEL